MGEGTVYEVFILDELAPGLDETTLAIDDDGAYSKVSWLLSWGLGIGEIPLNDQESVSYGVTVKIW